MRYTKSTKTRQGRRHSRAADTLTEPCAQLSELMRLKKHSSVFWGVSSRPKESHELKRLHVYVRGFSHGVWRVCCGRLCGCPPPPLPLLMGVIFGLLWLSRQSLSCVLIPFPCVLPGSRAEFVSGAVAPFAPRHHRTTHHGISTHLLHFGVTGFLLSPMSCI